MAILIKVPCFLSLSPFKLLLNHHQQEDYKLCRRTYASEKRFSTCACSFRKPRSGRKVKSNIELRNDIRDFVSTVGLPEGHVPSLKELSDHGRTDLANIVRRRGYKVIRDILSNSADAAIAASADKSLDEGHEVLHVCVNIPTDPDETRKGVVEDGSLSTSNEVPLIGNNSGSSDISPENFQPTGLLANFSLEDTDSYYLERQDENVESVVEDLSLSTPTSLNNLEQRHEEFKRVLADNALSMQLYCVDQQNKDAISMAVNNSSPAELSLMDGNFDCLNMDSEASANSPMKEEGLSDLKGQDVDVNNITEDSSLSTGVSNVVAGLTFSYMSMDSATNLSMEEKVAKFIQNGDLDAIDDRKYCDENATYGSEGSIDSKYCDENGTDGSEGSSEPENASEILLKTLPKDNIEHAMFRSNVSLMPNGTLSTPKQIMPPVMANRPPRNSHLSAKDLTRNDVDKDGDVETNGRENQVEINRLKFMLHQKELELARLKEQIEKEQLALSALRTKAETEIRKAERLISEKDDELLAAVENLSGLVEVNVQYHGDGEIVEVAGSFNGWHHRIKMDPQHSFTAMDPTGSRKPRAWSTMLWLYPGVYEIKFIVDGHWTVDPHRESVSRGGFCNNILRVDGQ